MITRSLRKLAASASLLSIACSSTYAQEGTDFNEVGKSVGIILQNRHFEKLKWDAKLSERFLDSYLKELDPSKMFFTKQDVDGFTQKYGAELHTLLLKREMLTPATEIYEVYRRRATERIAFAKKVAQTEKFTFDANESVLRTRKDAPYATSEKEALDLWRKQVKEQILSENLRRETLAKMAKEQGKEDPTKKDKSPEEKVVLRYERLLHSITENDTEEVANLFLSAVTKTYDPHTEYMGYREISRFNDAMKNSLIGIGAALQSEEDGATKITGIVVGGPADKAGQLKLNDRIVGVDTLNTGEVTDVMFMKIDKVVDLIRGKENTEVRLKVEPAGAASGAISYITIKRAKVDMKEDQASAEIIDTIDAYNKNRKIGWITLPSFYKDFQKNAVSCADDVENLLTVLKKQKIDGLILDLRGNGGGALDEVCKMAGFFSPRGPVVQVKESDGFQESKESELSDPIYTGPMLCLIDKSSASASEILAGALQDANRAVIVGDSSTFGKGTVQQLYDVKKMMGWLANKERAGTIKITMQKFYRPSGDSTQLKGVASDVFLPGILEGIEYGEKYLDNYLPFDKIDRAAGLKVFKKENLFLPMLKEHSAKRVTANKDLNYLQEDIQEAKKRIAENKISLDKSIREKELAEADAKRVTRNAERKARYAETEKLDKAKMKFFKLTLDDVLNDKAPQPYDPSAEKKDFMVKAKDPTEELDDTPKYPSGIDPIKRESFNILSDLIEATEASKVAGTLKAVNE